MSTPEDLIGENNTPPEQVSVTEPYTNEDAPVYDGNIDVADPNFVEPIQYGPQYASLGIGKAATTVQDLISKNVDAFKQSYNDNTAIIPPNLREEGETGPLPTIQRETDQSRTLKGDAPIAVTEDTGETQIRKMGIE